MAVDFRPDDVSHCITVKSILAGEQVFVNYLENCASMTLNERQIKYAYEMNYETNSNRSLKRIQIFNM